MRYLKDEDFIRGRVPMTKEEIRILTLAKAGLAADSVIYDIGAGTGSLSIEAARLSPQGKVYALEKNPAAIDLLLANAAKFNVTNIYAREVEAPEGIGDLPPCDAALIGGSGGNMAKIITALEAKLKPRGRLVINVVTIQSLAAAIDYLGHNSLWQYEAIQAQITRLTQVGSYDMAKALNPVYIVTARRL